VSKIQTPRMPTHEAAADLRSNSFGVRRCPS
jgi:hypothetical protein